MCGIFCLPQGFEGLPEDRAPWCGVPHDIHQTLLWDLQNKPRRGSIASDIHAFVSVGSTSEAPLFVFTCALLRLPDGRKPQVKGVYAFQKDEPNTSDKGWERRIIRRSCDGLLLGVGVDCHIVLCNQAVPLACLTQESSYMQSMYVFMYAPGVCHSSRMRTGTSDSISANSVEGDIDDPIVPCNLRD